MEIRSAGQQAPSLAELYHRPFFHLISLNIQFKHLELNNMPKLMKLLNEKKKKTFHSGRKEGSNASKNKIIKVQPCRSNSQPSISCIYLFVYLFALWEFYCNTLMAHYFLASCSPAFFALCIWVARSRALARTLRLVKVSHSSSSGAALAFPFL